MNYAIDLGNTQIKLGIFKRSEIVQSFVTMDEAGLAQKVLEDPNGQVIIG